MRTKEFVEQVEKNGFIVLRDGHQIALRFKPYGVSFARINEFSQQTEMFEITFSSPARLKLLGLIAEYTLTPVSERENTEVTP